MRFWILLFFLVKSAEALLGEHRQAVLISGKKNCSISSNSSSSSSSQGATFSFLRLSLGSDALLQRLLVADRSRRLRLRPSKKASPSFSLFSFCSPTPLSFSTSRTVALHPTRSADALLVFGRRGKEEKERRWGKEAYETKALYTTEDGTGGRERHCCLQTGENKHTNGILSLFSFLRNPSVSTSSSSSSSSPTTTTTCPRAGERQSWTKCALLPLLKDTPQRSAVFDKQRETTFGERHVCQSRAQIDKRISGEPKNCFFKNQSELPSSSNTPNYNLRRLSFQLHTAYGQSRATWDRRPLSHLSPSSPVSCLSPPLSVPASSTDSTVPSAVQQTQIRLNPDEVQWSNLSHSVQHPHGHASLLSSSTTRRSLLPSYSLPSLRSTKTAQCQSSAEASQTKNPNFPQTPSSHSPPPSSNRRVRLKGVGSQTPNTCLTNSDLVKLVDTSDEWISSRTGIRNRRVLGPHETLQNLAVGATRNALEFAQLNAADVDLIVYCSSTPDDLFGDATEVASAVGATSAVAWDLTAACSGFVFGLVSASQFLQNGAYGNAVVVGADALTRWVDWTDRNTCILFGDGAAAVVIEATDPQQTQEDDRGLLSWRLRSDGAGRKQLCLPYAPKTRALSVQERTVEATEGDYRQLGMNGREVFKFAVREVPLAVEEALGKAGLKTADVDWLLLHQANTRIMDAVAQRLGIPKEKILSNVQSYGNTSAASIPLCLDEAVRTGKVKAGHTIAMAGFGAGLSWGAAVVRWG